MMPISAGFTTTELPTPPHGELAGYAVPGRLARTTLHPLTATTARFDLATTLVWVGIDALAVSRPLRTAIRTAIARRLPGAAVLVSASHTHSAPGAWCGTIHPLLPAPLDPAEIHRVADRIADTLPGTQPVQLVHGVAEVTGVGTNRDDPDRPIDTSVGVLAALPRSQRQRSCTGAPVGIVVDHACHPTVLGPDSTAWSPDWIAGLRSGIAESLDGTPVLFLQGAAGDVSTRFTRRASRPEEALRIGRLVADGALTALGSATAVDLSEGIRLRRHTLDIHRRDAVTELRSIDSAPPQAGAPAPQPGTGTGDPARLARARREGLAGLRALAAHPGPAHLEAPVCEVRIGSARYLTTPFELPNSWGRRLAEAGRLRVIGYTDDYLGYLADPAAHRAGTYEATSSYADAAESERLLVELTRIAAAAGTPTR